MSTDVSNTGHGGDHTTPTLMGSEDADATPRLEAPVAVKVSTPSTVMAETAREASPEAPGGYFTARPAASELQRHPVFSSSDPSSPNLTPVELAPARQTNASESSTLRALDRPTTHPTNPTRSVQSPDNASTGTAPSSAPILTPSGHQRPQFPNQAYSALHSQKYPVPRVPPSLKQRGTHPGQIFTFTSALASLHQPASRTVGSSAPVTPGPGLFNLQQPPTSSEWESVATPGTYASPFLHFTQRTQPKETYVADVDVDPISGRKLINQYEIIDELGRGTHGKVKLGRDLSTDGTYVAIKIVDRLSKRRKLGKLGTTEDKVKKEVAILKQVRHPNVTALLEVIDDPTRKKVYIVLEWVELGQIQWRVKGAKEVAAVEARRYEREKSGRNNRQLDAEDAAVFVEAQRRLSKHGKKQMRTFRQIRQEAPSEIWSHETAGEDESEVSDEDKLSRISTESFSNSLLLTDGRRSSRTPSPLPPQSGAIAVATTDGPKQYLPLTQEPQSQSPLTLTNVYTGLEGTMYGPYGPYIPSMPGSGEHSRGNSTQTSGNSRHRAITNSDSLKQMAAEVLDSDLNDELEYVPVLTIHQIRAAFRDTLIGLQYLHYQGIIHRDIKPPNLLETKEHRVKISDFGVSYLGPPKGDNEAIEDVSELEAQDLSNESKELAKTVGTPAFYAPELCITEVTEDAPPITEAIDVWAFGITLFCMLFARTPFVDNEFVVMRQIAEENVYIPKKRLKPVEPKPRSRPSSQRRAHSTTISDRRHELELSYEELGDDLLDLLHRMLVKDPRKRIKLEEIRHHPWVVNDIQDKVKWLEETDSARQSQGKKIEVSKEDVNSAVVPLQFFDRVRNTLQKFGERFFSSKPATRDRTRSSVGGNIEGSPSPSNASASTNMSHNEPKSHPRVGEPIRSSLSTSNEGEHSLSRSVNVNPEQETRDARSSHTGPSQGITSAPGSQQHADITPVPLGLPERDLPPATSSNLTGPTSQPDHGLNESEESPPASPRLPGTPTALESPMINGSGRGVAQRILNSVRERSSARSSSSRAASSDRASLASIDTHGEPSLAVSQTVAAGEVNSSSASGNFTPTSPTSPTSSTRPSPSVSRPLSTASPPTGDRLYPSVETALLSRTSSRGSVSSLRRSAVRESPLGSRNSSRNASPISPHSRIAPESSDEQWQRAETELVRRRIEEETKEQEPASPFDDRRCPPSPDDHRQSRLEARRISDLHISESSQEPSPTGQDIAQLPAGMVSSTSDFGSLVSTSMSNPSIARALSDSSVELSDAVARDQTGKTPTDLLSSDDTVHESERRSNDYDDSYDPHPLEDASYSDYESGDFDDSSDSDGGLVMSRRKSNARTGQSRASGSQPQSLTTSSKSSRRGSNSTAKTAKKISPEDSADEHQQTPVETGE